jgi:putative hydrolase of the HAD superfamily
VSAAETLYVGNDMLNDVWTASQCGLKTALFAGDKRSLRLREDDARCAALQPDVIVTSLSQILDIVGTTG